MIGFEQEVAKESVRADEGPDTRDVEKKKLYKTLALLYFLPPYGSRGVTRDYLLKVHRNQVFLVNNNDIKHFEVDLSPCQLKKHGVANNGLLVKKLNLLLESRQLPPLGFDHYEPPEQVTCDDKTWLYRVARMIDTTNLTEFFEKPVQAEPALTSRATNISHVYYGRLQASKYFFLPKAAKKDRKLWDALRDISDSYRTLQSQQLTIEVLQQTLQDAKANVEKQERQLGDVISKTALSYLALKHPQVSADTILKGAKDNHPEVQEEVHMACKLYDLYHQYSLHILQRQHPRRPRQRSASGHQGVPGVEAARPRHSGVQTYPRTATDQTLDRTTTLWTNQPFQDGLRGRP